MSPADVFGGQVAVITGAGAGIGEGLARHAARLGMRVVVADIDPDAAARVVAGIADSGGEATAVIVDVTSYDSVVAMLDAAEAAFGGVDLLVNNAGVHQFGYLWDLPLEGWDRLQAINVDGVFHGVKAAVPRMAARGGRIWNLSSIGAVTTIARQGSYLTSKHAVLGLTEALAVDLAHAGLPITAAVVLPAAVASRIFLDAEITGEGDVEAASAAHADMLALLPTAMDPMDAAAAVFTQAAAGEFYLLPQPEYVAAVMAERGRQLTERRAPKGRDRTSGGDRAGSAPA